jgi:hypothetical protein
MVKSAQNMGVLLRNLEPATDFRVICSNFATETSSFPDYEDKGIKLAGALLPGWPFEPQPIFFSPRRGSEPLRHEVGRAGHGCMAPSLLLLNAGPIEATAGLPGRSGFDRSDAVSLTASGSTKAIVWFCLENNCSWRRQASRPRRKCGIPSAIKPARCHLPISRVGNFKGRFGSLTTGRDRWIKMAHPSSGRFEAFEKRSRDSVASHPLELAKARITSVCGWRINTERMTSSEVRGSRHTVDGARAKIPNLCEAVCAAPEMFNSGRSSLRLGTPCCLRTIVCAAINQRHPLTASR